MTAILNAIGTATPPFSLSQEQALRLARRLSSATPAEDRLLQRIFDGARIERRGVILARHDDDDLRHFYEPASAEGPPTGRRMSAFEDAAPALGEVAAAAALAQAGVARERLTHLVTVSCTGFSAPGLEIALVDRLGLARTIQRTHIGFMGCHGAINGLRIAGALAQAHEDSAVLLCCVELCSLHHQAGSSANAAVANALFADGAAAAVITSHETAHNPSPALQIIGTGSIILPESTESMSWRIGDHGFEMTLAPDVPDLIRRHLRAVVSEFLGRHGLAIDRIGGWAIHPGGPKVVSSIVDCLGLREDDAAASNAVLAGHGNMSSPTVLFILDALRRGGTPRPWLALAFGPGLSVELALLG